jgi:hypothetical protein
MVVVKKNAGRSTRGDKGASTRREYFPEKGENLAWSQAIDESQGMDVTVSCSSIHHEKLTTCPP